MALGRSLALALVRSFDLRWKSVVHISLVGSTVPYVVERIVAQGKEFNKDRVFIPTG